MAKVKVVPLRNFHHEGQMVYAGSEPVEMDQARADAMKAAGNVRFEHDEVAPEPKISLLQAQGRPNAEPAPTPYPGDPVTPAPGDGPVERPEIAAEPPVDEGTVNPEPEPDTSAGPVSPPPGPGQVDTAVQDPHEIAERPRMKTIENRAPNDPGARPEDNYAFPTRSPVPARQRDAEEDEGEDAGRPRHRGRRRSR